MGRRHWGDAIGDTIPISRRGGVGRYVAALVDRCTFTIPASAGEVIRMGAARRDVVCAEQAREALIVKSEACDRKREKGMRSVVKGVAPNEPTAS